MSSNISVIRICEHCNNDFVAKTTVTRFCSDKCAKSNYKLRLKEKKIKASNDQTASKRKSNLKDISKLDFLNPTDASRLLQCSRVHLYELMNTGQLEYSQLSQKKRLIRRVEIERFIDSKQIIKRSSVDALKPIEKSFDLSNSLSMKEAQELYGISEKALYDLIKRNGIKKYKSGRYVFALKKDLDKVLVKPIKTQL